MRVVILQALTPAELETRASEHAKPGTDSISVRGAVCHPTIR